jgi:hypothetical protein
MLAISFMTPLKLLISGECFIKVTFLLPTVVTRPDCVVLLRGSKRLHIFKSLVELGSTFSKLNDSSLPENEAYYNEVPVRGINSVVRLTIRFRKPVCCVRGLLVTV